MKLLGPVSPLALKRAREMRHAPTPAEASLWRALRAGALPGEKVRRQVPLGHWIVDFAIVSALIIIEIDGETHASDAAMRQDGIRTAWLEQQGWRIVRFTNTEVMTNLDGVLTAISNMLPPQKPLSLRERLG